MKNHYGLLSLLFFSFLFAPQILSSQNLPASSKCCCALDGDLNDNICQWRDDGTQYPESVLDERCIMGGGIFQDPPGTPGPSWTYQSEPAGPADGLSCNGQARNRCFDACNGLLPVELLSFEAAATKDGVVLNWSTSSENNNLGFEIEQLSFEGWNTRGFVPGHGTSTQEQNYTFTINELDYGLNSFRLKQIDFDGKFEYSNVVETSKELENGFGLNPFYPNPFNPRGSFSLVVEAYQHVEIRVYDSKGRIVETLFQGEMRANVRQRFEFVAGENLPSGIYLIQIQGTHFSTSSTINFVK